MACRRALATGSQVSPWARGSRSGCVGSTVLGAPRRWAGGVGIGGGGGGGGGTGDHAAGAPGLAPLGGTPTGAGASGRARPLRRRSSVVAVVADVPPSSVGAGPAAPRPGRGGHAGNGNGNGVPAGDAGMGSVPPMGAASPTPAHRAAAEVPASVRLARAEELLASVVPSTAAARPSPPQPLPQPRPQPSVAVGARAGPSPPPPPPPSGWPADNGAAASTSLGSDTTSVDGMTISTRPLTPAEAASPAATPAAVNGTASRVAAAPPRRAARFPFPRRAGGEGGRPAAAAVPTRGAPAASAAAPRDTKAATVAPLTEAERVADVEERAAKAAMLAAPGPRYDPAAAEVFFRGKGVLVARRQARIAVPLAAFVSKVILDLQMGREVERRPARAKEFLDIIASLGPAFIKAGQALSSRPDLLPAEYLLELQKLQDRLPPFPNEVAFALIEAELGRPLSEVYASVDPVPVAAASIGQVYKGVLRGTGEAVAIKVQRPDCEQIIATDMYILRNLSGLFTRLFKVIKRDVDLQSVIGEFGKLIYEEIDYLSEARNAERFLTLYGDVPDVSAPKIFWRFSNRRVLTMQWVDGVRLTSEQLADNSHLVQTLVQCSLRQMLENGFFHADPHGGNLLATPSGRLCYLDFGMMSEVGPAQRYGIILAVVHMVNRDFEALSALYIRLGFLPPDTDLSPIVAALEDALPDVLGASVGELNFKSVINKLGSVMYRFPFSLPPYYTAILRCLGVLEGLAIQVDPNFKILNEAYPYIASRLLTDPAPELQEALQYLLFKDGRPRWNRLESLLDSATGAGDYDVSLAAEQLADFLLSPKGTVIRANLAADVVAEVDTLAADTSSYYLSTTARTAAAAGLWVPPGLLRSLPPPVSTPAMNRAAKVWAILSRSRGGNASKLAPIVRRVVTQPEGQRVTADVALNLAQRASSRFIRFTFGLPEEPGVGTGVYTSTTTAGGGAASPVSTTVATTTPTTTTTVPAGGADPPKQSAAAKVNMSPAARAAAAARAEVAARASSRATVPPPSY